MARTILAFLLIIASACICLPALYSQNKFAPEWNVGIGFGPTFSSVDFRNQRGTSVSTKSYMQYHGGIAVRYLSDKNLGLLVELNYSQQGWDEDFKDKPTPEASFSHTLNYFELPVMTHIYFGRKVRFIFNVGPKFSFLMSDSEKMSDNLAAYLASGEVNSLDITHQYYRMAEKKFDYGIIAGMGMEVRTGVGNFTLEGRYTIGFGDIYNNTKADYFQRSANRVISARLTYYIKAF